LIIRYDEKTDQLHPSLAAFDTPPSAKTRLVLESFAFLRLIKLDKDEKGIIKSTTNMTILNTLLVNFGPMHEQTLCLLMGAVQVLGSAVAFGIRYGVGSWVYGGERR
jgi:UDP-N-acetylglucosamine--dolichyl-phosphate N-acetylglucosaminephosphotransferase